MKKRTIHNWQYGGKIMLRCMIATVLCAFLYLSVTVLSVGIFGGNRGYRITEEMENGEIKTITEVRYKVGEKEITKMDLPEGQHFEIIREVSPGVQTTIDVILQLIMVGIVASFPYSMMWTLGDKDCTGVRYKGKKYEPLRGMKIGLLASIPYFVLYVLLWVFKYTKVKGYLSIFRLIHLPFLPFINGIISPAHFDYTPQVLEWQLVAILPYLLVVPAACCLGYYLGIKQISVKEHITFVGVKKGNENAEI